ncbi:penicillin-binding protein [Flavicella sediminum]|uniref:penicillin-binding protein n=1 Tax=Flavicella sediminum TaxID=2585141 RepID=UPI00112074F9|nr:penicillin-binding protein [Flavicella sediminum]
MTLFLLVIFIKITRIQYIEGEKYRSLSENRTVRNDTIFSNRGNVVSEDGNLLATSMSKYTIRMDVVTVKNAVFEKNIRALSEEMSKMFGKPVSEYQAYFRKARRNKNRYLLIARNLGYMDYLKVKSFPIFRLGANRGGFITEQRTVRAHPIGKIAERTIGHGNVGIEGAYADYLKGSLGWRMKQKIANNQWKPINDNNEVEPRDGSDVITTLDINVQDIAHHALLKQLEDFDADHGCVIVMETKTGAVKAISNLGRTSSGKYYERLNYAVGESHEPGSTFKVASLLVALEDKVIDTGTIVDTEKGRIFIHRKKVEDSHHGGYGKISAARVIEVSSNVGIVKIIQEHYDKNPQKFVDAINNLGLGSKLGLRIKGEGLPYIPSPKDKKRWNGISLEWMAWGYGVSLTPLQIITFYNAIANDGKMVKPQFVKALRTEGKIDQVFEPVVLKERIASQETIKKLRRVLENVVIKGTADNIYTPNFSMAGKTGTAKKVVNGVYSNQAYVASFAGFFPADEPKYSCLVVVHNPDKKKGYYGATVAAPVFKTIAEKMYASAAIKRQVTNSLPQIKLLNEDVEEYYKVVNSEIKTMPNVRGMAGMDAISVLENLGLKVQYEGIGTVKSQSIRKGERITKGATIILKLS